MNNAINELLEDVQKHWSEIERWSLQENIAELDALGYTVIPRIS